MSFEQAPKQERNLEKDKSSFIEAIKNAQVSEIEAVFDGTAAEELKADLTNARVFLLGETHGVRENPDIIYTLFKKFGFRNLALEWAPSVREVVERYVRTGEMDFDPIQSSPDGRITAGHFALVKKLREEGLLETFVCFDEGGASSWDKRDENMAQIILDNLNQANTLVVAGNLHTKTGPVTFEDEREEHHPMGEHINEQIRNVPAGQIRYLSGEFHNLGRRRFSEESDHGETSSARFYKAEGLYIFELPEAHPATVPDSSEYPT